MRYSKEIATKARVKGRFESICPGFIQIRASLQQTEEASEFDIGLPYALGNRNSGDEKNLFGILHLWNESITTLG